VEPFRVRITVRGYELDPQGHVNQAVYLQYAEHARWECLRGAGVTVDRLISHGIGPVALENTIRYLAELRGGDEVDVGCEFEWAGPAGARARTFRVTQDFRRPDGTPVAELTGVAGMLDLTGRRLVTDPAARLRSIASSPERLGL
jgi:acyl-CoA thioester hydrolase